MTSKVAKFLKLLDLDTRRRLVAKLIDLKMNPYGMKGVKKIKAFGRNVYRLRVGKIRIIYVIVDNKVEILDIDFRGNVY
ncbi:type II toxin-antitoxin system RelE/ParE family toxin [Candidatus Peregrinibacteria bacterium]|jgi:mRNA-degrading endonuclease RelE of RelBE toxin-antitoxin system|nr:type II toxin-antitoxin system RelE/ParE family toxin [Candidatus Peregrinibacteria bacterium]MBT4631824.1 type II toxin-antitoxin system RelE/ParE family toxin [Candidatus Peregrinibacteria bacterium]MBT5517276.1 type II toxin-antitoxin system RelE/ParE family toxin [Candidatus Peregrinibacteria bacterium]MBT5824451.1 type II toxin-antitoxin system RelE/ParE family toxin [Candidatus Peregrinibacteria bacterium]